MGEFETTGVTAEMLPADKAVRYVLERVINSRDFSWHMLSTQTLRLCIRAEATRTGQTEADVEKWLHEQMEQAQPRLDRNGEGKPQLVVAREKLDAIREVLHEFDDRGDMDAAVQERIEAIIDGRKPRPVETRDKTSVARSRDMPSWLAQSAS